MDDTAQELSKNFFLGTGVIIVFLVSVLVYSFYATGSVPTNIFLTIAALFAAYMAMNIGANDVANNVGPAVGSKALTMTGAIIIAGIFEASGAFIAGGDVVGTIKKGIIDIAAFGGNTDSFIWAMMAALLAAGLWLNVATKVGAPVSTTHSIVGGVMGAGIAAGGFSIVSWSTMGKIASSWIISPLLGGLIAAIFLYSIKKTIVFKENKIVAAKKWIPIYVAIMTWSFTAYLTLKGLKKIWPSINDIIFFIDLGVKPSFLTASIFGLIVSLCTYFLVKSNLDKKNNLDNTRESVNSLLTVPLIFAAALLSFAHGANDVANAIGPLAAIADAVISGGISSKASIPLWVMSVGAIGIVIGLAIFGPKLIKTVGSEITELDQMRAFSVAMAAAITVIIASQLGLPVSSTHIAIGGIFGVGFLREYIQNTFEVKKLEEEEKILLIEENQLESYKLELKELESNIKSDDNSLDSIVKIHEVVDSKMAKMKKKDMAARYQRIVILYNLIHEEEEKIATENQIIANFENKKYVKRSQANKIILAWIITVPTAALLSSAIYFMIRGMML